MRNRAAGQDKTGFFLIRRQGLELVRAVRDAAFQHFAFAGAAGTVLAAVRQANALANRSGQQGFVRVGGEGSAAGLHGNVKHVLYP